MTRAQAISAYCQTNGLGRVEGAAGSALVRVLYEELLDRLAGLGGAIAFGQAGRRNREAARCDAILASLTASLDERLPVSRHLAQTYRVIGHELHLAVSNGEPARCGNARALIVAITDAWRAMDGAGNRVGDHASA